MTADPPASAPRVGLLGWPLGHTLSPALFARAFAARRLDWRYEAWATRPEELAARVAALRAGGTRGFNVTIPHKETILGLLDGVGVTGSAIGAVNFVLARNGRLLGENTDASAFLAALRTVAKFRPRGRGAVVLGAGGAARAVAWVLAQSGAASVTVCARDPERARGTAAVAPGRIDCAAPGSLAEVLAAADLLVNATPVGMAGGGDESGIPFGVEPALRPGLLVADLVYRPRETPLLAAARRRGAATLDGLPMLAWQAAAAFTLWTNAPMEGSEMLSHAEAAAGETR